MLWKLLAATAPMKNFLQEFWLWIVIPFALVLVGLAVLYFLSGQSEGTSSARSHRLWRVANPRTTSGVGYTSMHQTDF